MFIKYPGIIIMFITCCLRYVTAILCYECTSINNSMCLEPTKYDDETLKRYLPTVDCEHGILSAGHHGFFCRKVEQTIFHKGYEPDVRVTRSCGWIKHHRDCYIADNEDHLETVCQCFENECNAANNLKLPLMSTIIIVGLSFIL